MKGKKKRRKKFGKTKQNQARAVSPPASHTGKCQQEHSLLSSSPCHQGSQTGCDNSHSTAAASSRTRNQPQETRHSPDLTNTACAGVWHCQCPRFLGTVRNSPFPAPLVLPPCGSAHGQATLQHHGQQDKRICRQVTS